MSFWGKKNLIEHHRFSSPEFECEGDTARLVDKVAVEIAERFDDEIFQKIIEIAKKEGINCVTVLNKHEIAVVLKKSVPMKPSEDRYPWVICPACGGSVYVGKVQEHIQNRETTYCEHCGQALDWRDGNE